VRISKVNRITSIADFISARYGKSALLGGLVTVIAVAVGALVLDEHLSIAQLVGGATIIVGCALVLGLLPTRRRRTTSASRS
jgi:drug/metabolite transporter (DMT)-like permease